MNKENIIEIIQNEVDQRKHFIIWVKEHKRELLLTGISITAILATAVASKNRKAIIELWDELKKLIDRSALYSSKWFEKATIEELEAARKLVQQDYNNPGLDLNYRNYCWELLNKFDNAILKKRWAGKEYGYPAHSSNGWYLPSDD